MKKISVKIEKNCKYIIGIDEVGRGPLAGPLAIGVVCIPVLENLELPDALAREFPVTRDSKQLSVKGRDEHFKKIKELQRKDLLQFVVRYTAPEIIDKSGLTKALESAIRRALSHLAVDPAKSYIYLDGSLKAPREYTNQRTIIKGDETELPIALASIVAKVARDRKMCLLAKQYPGYGFESHKGYCTKLHTNAIRAYGLCKIHRRSFCHWYTAGHIA